MSVRLRTAGLVVLGGLEVRLLADVIQTNAAINPATPVGPLLDSARRLIGRVSRPAHQHPEATAPNANPKARLANAPMLRPSTVLKEHVPCQARSASV
jgi:S1-C subfamily serine protease